MAFPRPGGGGASTFPVGPKNDGTDTFGITAGSGQLLSQVTNGATPANIGGVVATADNASATAILEAQTTTQSFAVSANAQEGTGLSYLDLSGAAEVYLMIGTGDPNTVSAALKGSLFVDAATPKLYQNTDGATAWTAFT